MVFIAPFMFLRVNAPPQLTGFFVMIPVTIVVCPSFSLFLQTSHTDADGEDEDDVGHRILQQDVRVLTPLVVCGGILLGR